MGNYFEQAAKVEHPSLAKLEGKNTLSVYEWSGWMIYVPDKTPLKINGAEGQPGQPLGVSRLLHYPPFIWDNITASFKPEAYYKHISVFIIPVSQFLPVYPASQEHV
jgi:hypothetical protein